jgi:hypothetical protein
LIIEASIASYYNYYSRSRAAERLDFMDFIDPSVLLLLDWRTGADSVTIGSPCYYRSSYITSYSRPIGVVEGSLFPEAELLSRFPKLEGTATFSS